MRALYLRLAADGIRRERRFYLPFLLTAAGVSAVQYILFFLAGDVGLDQISGGATLRAILQLGSFVIAAFAALFLFYTHAFLTRRRGREFGLYSVLGMGKRSLASILFWETLFSFVLSLSIGLLAGAALAKLAELGLYRITGGTVNYSLRLSGAGLGETVAIFGVIFLLLFFDSLRRIGLADTVTLTKSESLGEKPPRANPVLGVLGLLLLGGAYALAITIKDPIAAIGLFFFAVLMVIVGTYLVFIAGSVLLCRLLQRNKRYYYKPAHFVSVSSMAFRMKRNGAGLASVCILATMVLVMISSTTCLYFGEEDVVRTRYPEDMRVEFVFWDDEETDAAAADTDALRALVLAEAADAGAEPIDFRENFTVYPKSGNARYICTFDTAADDDAQTALWRALLRRFRTDEAKEQYGYAQFFCDSRAVARGDFYGSFGGMFFLGILLSSVFICAAVLILYYKQITEAAEDASRFAIMQKVGMTAREIRQSVNRVLPAAAPGRGAPRLRLPDDRQTAHALRHVQHRAVCCYHGGELCSLRRALCVGLACDLRGVLRHRRRHACLTLSPICAILKPYRETDDIQGEWEGYHAKETVTYTDRRRACGGTRRLRRGAADAFGRARNRFADFADDTDGACRADL